MVNCNKRFRLGVNYWPRHHGVRMWREWEPEEIDREFAEMKSVRLDLARIFIDWDSFQPIKEYLSGGAKRRLLAFRDNESVTSRSNPCMIDPVMVKRFDTLIEIAEKYKIDLEPALITGWMSGAFLEPSYRRDRNVYTDPFMLKWQSKLVQFFAERYKNEKRIWAWALGNECNCMMNCFSEEAAWLWTANLTRTLHLFDPNHPIVSSMHSLGLTSSSTDNKWKIEDQAELCDILAVHPYSEFTPGCELDSPTDIRTVLHAAAESEMYSDLGKKPVLCEETGALGDSRFSQEETAKFLRLRLYTLLSQGNLGCLWWCHTDFTCGDIVPYKYEMMENDGLGIFNRQGNAKPVAYEFQKFSHILDAIGGKLPASEKKAVIIVPRNATSWLPCFNAYVLCKQVGIETDFAWEYDNLSKYQLAICPSVSSASPFWLEGWENLISFAKEGGVLYLSYGGASLRRFGEVFGIKINYRQKRSNQNQVMGFNHNPLYKGSSDWELVFGLTRGKTILSYKNGKPALVENKIGKGKTFFFAEPTEVFLSGIPNAYENNQIYFIYDYLRKSAGIKQEVGISDSQIERISHPIDERSTFLTLVNHHRSSVTVNVRTKRKIKKIEPITESVVVKGIHKNEFKLKINGCEGAILQMEF
ncbi:MAG: cellulase family glycosylhydrolase [Clostridia bacterium]|nr:cellulase family glycosylhydrolase [Clostridia bacterium]